MLRPRIIPCLLVHKKGLVKTQKFKNPKYVGDPLNAVRIFNEKEVDELIVIDIDCTVQNREPDFDLIKKLAYECRMPLCYGGGVKTVEQVMKIINLGVEKVAVSSAAVANPTIIHDMSKAVGSQSIVVVLDVKKKMLGYEVYTHNGKNKTGKNPVKMAIELEKAGAGEIVINSIDQDGMMSGYDIKLAQKIRQAVSVPLTFIGGAGSIDHLGRLITEMGVVGCAAGSYFVFKGKYRAVLISYPPFEERKTIYSIANTKIS